MSPRRFEVWLVRLDPTVGSEIQKARPCVVVSPDEMHARLRTVIVAPMTTAPRPWPTRVDLSFEGVEGQAALDQIRTVNRARLAKRAGVLGEAEARSVSRTLVQMFEY